MVVRELVAVVGRELVAVVGRELVAVIIGLGQWLLESWWQWL